MAHVSELIRLADFTSLPAGSTHVIGVKTVLHLPKVILELRHKIGLLAAKRGSLEQFYIQERGLYEPLEEVLIALLPKGAVVDHEPVLKKLANSSQKSDLTIRRLECYPDERLGAHEFAAIIEIKSVFFNERLSESDILQDLEKLLECETAYSAKCYFVLVGLKDDLTRVSKSLSKLLLHNAIGPISIALPSGKTAWLHPSARHVVDSPYLYVWTISNVNNFGKHSSDYTYTVFHAAT
ncbi:hypothetical protein AB8E26_12885 [Stenotrophomonas rhizophila]|uniref:hypothetical protein n=1 Tax=Stenotrophomonas rhizophila TaxID=216778 RepID=UPI003515FE77